MPIYQKLKEFITKDMVMSHVYQPIMLIKLLESNGSASPEDIAQEILKHDPTQI